MSGLKKTSAILLLSGLLQFASLSTAFCSGAEYRITETQLSTLENNLSELEQNNKELLTLLNGSETDLTIAQQQLEKSRIQIEKLTAQLNTLKAESDNAQKSLQIANKELASVCQSVKQLEAKKRRIEKQRDFWEGIAAFLGIWRIFG